MGLLSNLFTFLFPPEKQYGQKCVTAAGEEVKSQGEQRIADFFQRNGIRYEYERAINTAVEIFGARFFEERVSRPDFYLPEYDVYVEYWGMLDVDDSAKRREYERSMRWKMAQYHKYRIKFISIYPKNMKNLDWVFRTKFKEATGVELPRNAKHPSEAPLRVRWPVKPDRG